MTQSYDIRGNRSAITNALGHTRSYQYDLLDQVIAQVDPEGKATKFTYNQVGKLASLTKPGERTTQLCYDPNYNVKCMIDPKGYHYNRDYDMDNRLSETHDPLKQKEVFTYDAKSQLRSFADKMGVVKEYSYDPHGNQLMKFCHGSWGKLYTTYQYDLLDRLTSVTNPMGDVTSYCYDVMGNMTGMTDAMKRTSTYTYDVEGNLTSIVNAQGRKELRRYDMNGRQIGAVSNGKNKTFYQYDKLNHLIDKSYADAKGNVVDERVRYGYDKLGQRISMMDRSGESKYEYDSLGRIITVTTGSGEVTRYTYDECDQLSGIVYADGGCVSYEYDKNDNLTKVTDRTGGVTEYQYDALNRITTILRPNGINTYNTYNARNQITVLKNMCADKTSYPHSESEEGCGWVVSEYHYTYDDQGLIVHETAMESIYDEMFDGKWTGTCSKQDGCCPHGTHHNGKHHNHGKNKFELVVTDRRFTYDGNGRLLRCMESDELQGDVGYYYTYDEVGNRIRFEKTKYKECVQREEYTYNASNQMLRKTIYNGKNRSVVLYCYDKDGNRIAKTGRYGKTPVDVSYLYSVENRLKAVYNGKELLMAAAYDGDGNRIFQLNYHEKDDRGSQNCSGVLFPVPQKTGRLEQELMDLIKIPEQEKNYELIEYVNDVNREHTEVLMELNVNGKIEHAYSYGVNRLSRDGFTKEVSYYHYDPRGSVTGVTDENAVLGQTYRYEPFGNLSYGKPKFQNVYAYNGESYNPNIESQYLRARYYDTTLGNFYSEDRYLGNVLDPLSLNRYNYCKSSPVNYVDPSGHVATIDDKFKNAFNYAFGFSDTESEIMIELFEGISKRKFQGYGATHEFVKLLASVIYNDNNWQILSSFYSVKQVNKQLKFYGLDDEKIAYLTTSIKEQYRLSSGSYNDLEKYIDFIEKHLKIELCENEYSQYENYYNQFRGKSDFAHMLATMEAYFNDPDLVGSLVTGATNGVFSKAKNLGYAGDIYGVGKTSPSLGADDYMADLDAVNLAMLLQDNEDFLETVGDYFAGIEDGTINRAIEFAKNLGYGSAEKGKKELKKEVDKFVNKQIRKSRKGKNKETDTALLFLNNILNENNEWIAN